MHYLPNSETVQPLSRGPLTTSTYTGESLGLGVAGFHYPSAYIHWENGHMDRLSKQGHFIGLGSNFTAPQVAEIFMHEIVCLDGVPTSLISDRDPIFMSQF